MKKLLFVLIAACLTIALHAQEDTSLYTKYPSTYGVQYPRLWSTKVLRTPFNDTSALNALPGAIQAGLDGNPYWWNGTKWSRLNAAADLDAYVKFADSIIKYVTPAQLKDSLTTIDFNRVLSNGADVTFSPVSNFNAHYWHWYNIDTFLMTANYGFIFKEASHPLGQFKVSTNNAGGSETGIMPVVSITDTFGVEKFNINGRYLTFREMRLMDHQLFPDINTGYAYGAGFITFGNGTNAITFPTNSRVDIGVDTKDNHLGATPAVFSDSIAGFVGDKVVRVPSSNYISYSYNAEIWVDTLGNDATAVLGNANKPARTIDHALNMLPSTGGVINIGRGSFTSPARDSIKSNIMLIGSGKPKPNWTLTPNGLSVQPTITRPTALVGGTVLKGRLWLASNMFDNISVINLGVDAGLAYCNTYLGGQGTDALYIAQDTTHPSQVTSAYAAGYYVDNVATLCKDDTTLYHSALIENTYNAHVSNISTYFGTHGLVLKGYGTVVNNFDGHGHGTEGLFMKYSDYAYGEAQNVSNVYITSIVGFDGGGIAVGSDGASAYNEFAHLHNFNVEFTKYGIKNFGRSDGFIASNGSILSVRDTAIKLDGNAAFTKLSNIDVRGGNTGAYINTTRGYTQLSNISAFSATNNGINLIQSSTGTITVNNLVSSLNTGSGYNLSGTVYGDNIKGTNNGLANIGSLTRDVAQASNFMAAIDSSGNVVKTGLSVNQFTAGGETLASVTARGASTSTPLTLTGKVVINVNDGLNVGSTTEKLHFGANGGFSPNRNVATGAIDDNTRHAYQWQHTGNTTNTSDFWAMQVYQPTGGQVTASAISVNGAGNVGIGTTAQAGIAPLTVNGNIAPLTDAVNTLGVASNRWNISYVINTLTNFIKPVSGTDVAILNGSSANVAKFFTGTANLVLQNGGTFTDAGYRLDVQGTARATGNITLPHIIGGSATPAIAANTGAGTSPTISISGTDLSFRVTLTAGTSPTAGADLFTVTFANAYGATPRVSVAPINANAAGMGITTYSTSATTTYKLTTTSGASLAAGQQYVWDITITQ